MSTSPQQASFYASQTVATLFSDADLREKFMQAYNTSPEAIKAFLVDEMKLPDDLATEISSREDQALSNYIGQLVCDYLW
jgi:hypothetical protein